MKKILILLSFLFALNSVTIGQHLSNKLPKKITISGYVPDSCLKVVTEKLDIFFHERFSDLLWHEGKIIPVKIINNRFSVTIQPKGEISYFQIREGVGSNCLLTSLDVDAFLINAGDSIFINFITPEDASFSGLGAEKMNYQMFAGKLALDWGTGWQSARKNNKELLYWKQLANEHLGSSINELKKIKNTLTTDTYKVLSFSTTAAIQSNHLGHLSSVIVHNNFPIEDSLYLSTLKNEILSMDVQQRGFASTDTIIINNSSNYISYLSEFQLKYNQIFSGNNTPKFDNTYQKVISNYTGILRDKILAYTINRCFESYGSENFLDKALTIVNDPESKRLLEAIYNAKTPGVNAYDFSFEDLNGKQLKLKDLRGKVVVLEAWFNGCIGCTILAKLMHPILEHYIDNPDVVFISLCVDRNKKLFLDGVKSSLYGSKNSVYVWTNGLGWEHPMCLYYKWNGYPNMLYIDKNGKIIRANKILSTGDAQKAEVIALIDKYIRI